MNFKADFIIGKNTDTSWAGVYGYAPETVEDLDRLGDMYAVVRMSTEVEDFAMNKFAKIVVETLEQSYFEDLKDYKSTLERLEEACWKMKRKIDMLLSREKEVSEIGVDVEMAIVVVKKEYLYAITIGESKIYISREGGLVEISKGLIDTKGTGFIKSASLEIQQGDKFCLTTSKGNIKVDKLDISLENLTLSQLELDKETEGSSVMFIASEELDWNKGEAQKEEKKEPEPEVSKIEEEPEARIPEAGEPIEDEEKDMDEVIPEDEPAAKQTFEEKVLDGEEEQIDEMDDQSKEEEPVGLVSNLKGKLSLYSTKLKDRTKSTAEIVKKKIKKTDSTEEEEEMAEREGDMVQDEKEIDNKNVGKRGLPGKFKNIATGAVSKVDNHFRENQTTYAYYLKNFVSKITGFVSGIVAKFKKEILGINPDRRIRTKSSKIKRNRYLFIIIVVVLSVFLYTSYNKQQQSNRENNAIDEIATQIIALESEFQSVSNQVLNNEISDGQDKESVISSISALEGRVNGQVSITSIKENLPEEEKAAYLARLNNLTSQLNSQKEDVLQIDSFIEPQIIADLSVQYQDATLEDMEYSEGFLFVADSGRNVIYRLTPEIGSPIEEHISNVTQPRLLVKNVANEIIVYDSDQSLVAGKFLATTKDSLKRFPGLTPPTVGKVDEVAIYSGNDALYELRTLNSYIFRRTKTGDQYSGGGIPFQQSAGSTWRIDSTFKQGVDIETPYEIYMLIQGVGLSRHFAGEGNTINQETFKGLLASDYNAIKSATALDVTIKHVAIGDSVNKRVLLLAIEDNAQKNLIFVKQFQYKGGENIFSDIKELQINETDGKIYVLDGNRVIRLDI